MFKIRNKHISHKFKDTFNINRPQDQGWRGPLETDRMNYVANFQDSPLHSGFDSKACCSLDERHWKELKKNISVEETKNRP